MTDGLCPEVERDIESLGMDDGVTHVESLHEPLVRSQINKWSEAKTQSTGFACFTDGNFDRRLISYRYRQGYHHTYVEQVKLRLQLLEVGSVLARMDHSRNRNFRECVCPTESCIHALNMCDYSSYSMTKRHDAVQKRFVWSLRKRDKEWDVHEANRFHDSDGNLAKPDLVIVDRSSGKVYITDIAVHYETDVKRAKEVMRGKEVKYQSICSTVAEKFKVHLYNVSTEGLAVGSRGSFSKALIRRLSTFGLSRRVALNMAQTAANKTI